MNQFARVIRIGILLVAFNAPVPLHGAAAADPLVLSTSTVAPFNTPARTGFVDRLTADAFGRIGRDGRIAMYPNASARALMLANQGLDDGAALRIAGLEEAFPNLRRVPEPVMVNEFVAYTRDEGMEIDDWADLQGRSVAYILGWAVFENNVVGAQVTQAKDALQLFQLLAAGRADIVLYERWQGLALAREQGLSVVVHEPPLASAKMYMYLHSRHEDLVDHVAAALRALKADGTYDRLVRETLLPFAAPGP